jgi:hypothetical protein
MGLDGGVAPPRGWLTGASKRWMAQLERPDDAEGRASLAGRNGRSGVATEE